MPENVPNVQTESPPSMAALVQGIVNDAQKLIRQEITLARTEIKKDWDDLRQAGGALAAGGVIAFLGVLFLGFMVVYLLHLTGLDLWACYLIVGGVLAAVGGALIFQGIAKLRRIELGPEKTIETIKEIV
jgi:hypothetical protein